MRDTTKPERSAWLIWSVLGTINLASQYALGVHFGLMLVLMQAIGITLIFMFSLWRGIGLPGVTDVIALFVACQGLALWHFTNNALIALYIVICIDAIGVVLAALKAYNDPSSETVSAWVLAGLAGVVTVTTMGTSEKVAYVYPIYTISLNIVVLTAIWCGKRALRDV